MLKKLITLFALASVATAAPGDNALTKDTRQTCAVNAVDAGLWVDDGLTRREVHFSVEGTKPDDYCMWWMDHPRYDIYTFFNPQCYHDAEKGTWRIDSSWFRGPQGDGEYYRALQKSIDWWVEFTGCTTG